MTADLTHLAGRVPDGQGHPAETGRKHVAQVVGAHHEVAARMLADAMRDGDAGGVRRLIAELEHELGPLRVNPWRLIERLAAT